MTPTATTVPTSALLGVYAPRAPLFVEGRGAEMVAEDGTRYLDFTAGIGVNALGHGAPEIREAVLEALDRGLVHVSNLFRTAAGEELATLLVEKSFPGRVFFCNSGAEANEAAFKFARRHARERGGEGKHEIVAFRGSFHGRLFASLAATDRPGYREPFEPLVPGIRFAEIADGDSLRRVTDPRRTAAVIVEPVQGEGGVRPVPTDFLRELRARCDEIDAALVLDEVQCGLGRTGALFAHREAGIVPDLLTLAKPLAGGLPMGAVVVGEEVAASVRPGDHATTFGGGPLVASVAKAVVGRISEPGFLEAVREKGERVGRALRSWEGEHAGVTDVRGRGLIRGLEIPGLAGEVVDRAHDAGLLVLTAGEDVVRLLPPLTVTGEELERGLDLLGGAVEGALAAGEGRTAAPGRREAGEESPEEAAAGAGSVGPTEPGGAP